MSQVNATGQNWIRPEGHAPRGESSDAVVRPTENYVFVYGTLRAGYNNHRTFLMTGDDVRHVSKGRTVQKFTMRASGIPFVNKDDPRSHIIGEVYCVSDDKLKHLDRLEGHPDWYVRELTSIKLDSGTIINAWLYFNEETRCDVVESGDYTDYREPEL